MSRWLQNTVEVRSPKALLLPFLLLIALVGGPFVLMGQPSPVASSGRSFVVALPAMGSASDHLFRVTVTARNDCQVSVRFVENDSTATFVVAGGGRLEMAIPRSLISLDVNEYTARRSIEITSTDLVTVNAISDASALTDGYLAIPTESLGFDYYAPCFPTPANAFTYGSIIAVVATVDGTHIAVTPTTTTLAGHTPGFSYGITLNRGEVYQLVPKQINGTDLTGTRITSDKPVAVISGHRGAALPEGTGGAANGLLEMIPPVSDWGRRFVGFTYPHQERGYYRILAASTGTEVRVNGGPVDTLAPLESMEFASVEPVVIETSRPVLVTQFTTHFPTDSAVPSGDPSMAILNPIDSWAGEFIWSTPSIAPRPWIKDVSIDIPYDHYLVVTAHDSIRGSVRLDGIPLALPIAHGNGPWHAGIATITAGAHRLTAAGPVNAQMLGYNDYDAYSAPVGMLVRSRFRGGIILSRTCASTFDTTIILSNVGDRVVDVVGAAFSPTLRGRIVLPASLPFSLPPNSTISLRVAFDSLRFGVNSGTLQLQTRPGGAASLDIPITIVRDSLALAATTELLHFDTLSSGIASRDTTLLLVNSGTAPIVVPMPTVIGPFSVVAPAFPVVLNVDDTLRLVLRFTPLRSGWFSGSVILSTTPCGNPVTIAVDGYRRGPAVIDVTIGSIPSLLCPLPATSETVLQIRNRGEENLHIDSITVEGSDRFDFTTDLPSGGIIIPGGDSAPVQVRFTPQGIGRRTALLKIWDRLSAGGFFVQQVEGVKDSAGGGFPVDSLDFGTLQGCGGETMLEVDLLNSGTVELLLDSLVMVGDDFVVVESPLGAIPPDNVGRVTLRFRPGGSGERRSLLILGASPCGVRDTLHLKGVQSGAGLLTDVDTLDFGLIPSCVRPQSSFVTIVNSGTTVDTIIESTITSGQFRTDDIAGRQLAPGESLRIAVDFTGSADGDHIGRFLLRAHPCDLERTVVLRARVGSLQIDSIPDIHLPGFTGPGVYAGRTSIRNSGTIALHLRDIVVAPPVQGLRIVAPALPVTIAPGETLSIDVEIPMTEGKAFTTTATVAVDSPCVGSPTFTIDAPSGGDVVVELSTADTSAIVDDLLALPIRATSSIAIHSGVTVRGELRWRRHLLGPLLLRPAIPEADARITLDSVAGDTRIVRFEYHGSLPTTGTLALLDVRALLGDIDTTTLEFTEGKATANDPGRVISTTLRNGFFRTEGICRIDGDRFVRLSAPTTFGRITPNPAHRSGYIDISLGHPSIVTLQLIDVYGSEVRRTSTAFLPVGSHRVEVDLGALTQGSYLCVVTAGTWRDMQSVVVVE